MPPKSPPDKLYKYAAFNTYTVRLLGEGEVFYSNPKNFNDPLDCNPTINIDTGIKETEALLLFMICKSPKQSQEFIDLIKHLKRDSMVSWDNDGDPVPVEDEETYLAHYTDKLISKIRELLNSEMSRKGVLALAENWNSPLMWSHYADEHRGICIEYNITPNHLFSQLKAVNYDSPRAIKISDLISWKIDQSSKAERNIVDTYFFAKAPEWHYENEWRDIDDSSGVKPAPMPISSIYFGLRCDSAVKTCIIKLLHDYAHCESLSFFQIRPHMTDFSLERYFIDSGEINSCSVGMSARLIFDPIDF